MQIPTNISAFFITLTLLFYGILVFGVSQAIKKLYPGNPSKQGITAIVALGLSLWLIFLMVISSRHILDQWNMMPPRLLIVLLPPFLFTLILLFSKGFGRLLKAIPSHWIILIHVFRILVEISLWQLAANGIIHHRLTFEGRNFDILIGITAIVVARYAFQNKLSKGVLIGWNIFGLLMLANIVIMAILSAPVPFRVFMDEPANTVIAYFPYVWLPGFLVPLAYSMHLFSIRKALLK